MKRIHQQVFIFSSSLYISHFRKRVHATSLNMFWISLNVISVIHIFSLHFITYFNMLLLLLFETYWRPVPQTTTCFPDPQSHFSILFLFISLLSQSLPLVLLLLLVDVVVSRMAFTDLDPHVVWKQINWSTTADLDDYHFPRRIRLQMMRKGEDR